MKKRYVLFNSNGLGARILVNPATVPSGAMLDPDISQVKGVSPSYWKIVDGKILEMSLDEKSRVSPVDHQDVGIISRNAMEIIREEIAEVDVRLLDVQKDKDKLRSELRACSEGLLASINTLGKESADGMNTITSQIKDLSHQTAQSIAHEESLRLKAISAVSAEMNKNRLELREAIQSLDSDVAERLVMHSKSMTQSFSYLNKLISELEYQHQRAITTLKNWITFGFVVVFMALIALAVVK